MKIDWCGADIYRKVDRFLKLVFSHDVVGKEMQVSLIPYCEVTFLFYFIKGNVNVFSFLGLVSFIS